VIRKIDKEILIGFLEEAMGYLPAIRQSIEDYIADHSRSDVIQDAHRLAHTIKGAASMVGFTDLSHVAHSIEETLEEIADSCQPMSEETATLLLTTLDEIESKLNELSHETHSEANDSQTETDATPRAELAEVSDDLPAPPQPFAAARANVPAVPADEPQDESLIDPEMLEVFSMEAEDHLRVISAGLAALDRDPSNREALQEVRRSSHTLKGAAGVVGLRTITMLAHRMEDLLDQLYDGSQLVTPDAMSTLMASAEVLENLSRGASERSVRQSVEELYACYAVLLERSGTNAGSISEAISSAKAPTFATLEAADLGEEGVIDLNAYASQTGSATESAATENKGAAEEVKRAARRVVRVPLERLDALVKLVSELVISRTVLEQRMSDLGREVEELQHSTDRLRRVSTKLETEYETKSFASGKSGGFNVKRNASEFIGEGMASLASTSSFVAPSLGAGIAFPGATAFDAHGFDELELDRYTEFHTLARELAETSSDTNAVGNELENLLGDFDQVLNRQRRLTSEIQERLMRVRMVPLSALATRLHRTVRVTADQEGKGVDLRLEGDNIELDTTVLDQMADPLLHLLRNAVGHGIELPATRRAHGKPERGTIRLRAFHEGTEVVIEISDDGGGLDPAVIRVKAVRQGFFSAAEMAAMSDKEVLNLIFLPGFSTAKEISEVSGRGVGMDVVKEHVTKLQGTVALDSVQGRGVTFTVRLPMTLAVTRALMVKAHGEMFAVPLSAVKQIMRVDRNEIERLGDEHVVRAGGNVYPVVRLGQALKLKQPAEDTIGRLPALILSVGGGQIALVVEHLVEGREVVIKSLGNHLRHVQGIMGATLLGDGRVIPILNPVDLVRGDANSATTARTTANRTGGQTPTARKTLSVMIVDDSPSVRRVMSNLIKGANWQFTTAKDGLEALEVLQAAPRQPDVILMDVEMPRMDGYELLAALKRQETYRHIPVVMITSRTGEKHRRKALDLGASEYLSKPYQDEVLLNLVQQLAK